MKNKMITPLLYCSIAKIGKRTGMLVLIHNSQLMMQSKNSYWTFMKLY
jgi:superfamily II DNA or RNA helicase